MQTTWIYFRRIQSSWYYSDKKLFFLQHKHAERDTNSLRLTERLFCTWNAPRGHRKLTLISSSSPSSSSSISAGLNPTVQSDPFTASTTRSRECEKAFLLNNSRGLKNVWSSPGVLRRAQHSVPGTENRKSPTKSHSAKRFILLVGQLCVSVSECRSSYFICLEKHRARLSSDKKLLTKILAQAFLPSKKKTFFITWFMSQSRAKIVIFLCFSVFYSSKSW